MRVLLVSRELAFHWAVDADWSRHTVEVQQTLPDARAALGRSAFDAVVCDVRISPGIVAALAQELAEVAIPLLAVGPDNAEERLASLQAGADDYLTLSPRIFMIMDVAIRAASERHRLEAADRAADLRVAYAGSDQRLRSHLASAPAVRVSSFPTVQPFSNNSDDEESLAFAGIDVALVDADDRRAGQTVRRLRRLDPCVPVALVIDPVGLDFEVAGLPFGVDDVIVRAYDDEAQIVPRLRSLASRRVDRPVAVNHLAEMAAESSPTEDSIPESVRDVAPVSLPVVEDEEDPPPPAVSASDVPSPIVEPPRSPLVEDTSSRPSWLSSFVGLARSAALGEIATDLMDEVADVLRRVDDGVDPAVIVERAKQSADAWSAFRERRRTAGVSLDRELERLTPILRELLAGWADLVVDHGAVGASLIVNSAELSRVITTLVVSCRESLPAGGTVHVRTRCAVVLSPEALPLPPGTSYEVVQIRVLRVGILGRAVPAAPTLARLVATMAGSYEPIDGPDGCEGVLVALPILADPSVLQD